MSATKAKYQKTALCQLSLKSKMPKFTKDKQAKALL